MMKKRIIAGFLALSIAGSMWGCGMQDTASTSAPSAQEQTEASSENEATEPKEPSEEVPESSGEEKSLALDDGKPWVNSDMKENIVEGMELSPKDDFHLYVNYDWLSKAEIQEGNVDAGPAYDISQETLAKALTLFEDQTLTSHDAKLIQDFYHAFMDWDTRNALGMEPVMETVEDIQSIQNITALSDFICDPERSFAVATFLAPMNQPDWNDTTSYIAAILNDGLLLKDAAEYENRTEYGERIYEANKSLAVALFERIGYETDEAEQVFDSVIALETELAKGSLTSEESMSPDIYEKINNVMSLEEAAALCPNFPMEKFIHAFGYAEAEKFVVSQPEYFKRLNEVYNEENLEAIKAYMLTNYLIFMAGALDEEAYDLLTECDNKIYGTTGQLSREEEAFNTVSSLLYVPMNRAYLEKYDATKMKEDITKLCEEIIVSYEQMLKDNEWLSEPTRERIINKLKNIKINAVYPEKWYDYSRLSLEGLTYPQCLKAIQKLNDERDLSHINQKIDFDEWNLDILECNAYYYPQENSINIPLGQLGDVFYQEGMTLEQLYGGIGAVIGHEISHAFDTNGAQFDENGNFADMWTPQDYEAFRERADKLVEYYDQIEVFDDQMVMGKNIQSEAIADITGLQCLLYMAKDIENFDYDQFFRQYAMSWRQLSTYEFEYMVMTQNYHPLCYLRTNTVVQQFQEFMDTYDVKPGDNMYLAPEDCVLIW